jgi:hypothetical protein
LIEGADSHVSFQEASDHRGGLRWDCRKVQHVADGCAAACAAFLHSAGSAVHNLHRDVDLDPERSGACLKDKNSYDFGSAWEDPKRNILFVVGRRWIFGTTWMFEPLHTCNLFLPDV